MKLYTAYSFVLVVLLLKPIESVPTEMATSNESLVRSQLNRIITSWQLKFGNFREYLRRNRDMTSIITSRASVNGEQDISKTLSWIDKTKGHINEIINVCQKKFNAIGTYFLTQKNQAKDSHFYITSRNA